MNKKIHLDNNEIKKISKKYNQKFENIKNIDEFQSHVILCGDEIIGNESNNNYWDIIEDEKIDIEKNTNNQEIFKNMNPPEKILLGISKRDRVILLGIKLNEKYTLKELSLRFGISIEAVRKISERRFNDLQKFMMQYKKEFIDKQSGRLNII